ncbi:MAG TPA: hypothetical protein VK137_07960, partial [Planctomycetaceae bacterium]|nr:hypothetical protein [Planctomycetaceae bacterium]
MVLLLSLSVALALGVRLLPRTSADNEFRLGRAALERGEWAAVSRHIARLRQNPAFADHVHVLRGGLLLRTGEPRGAIDELARVRAD